MFFEPPGRVTLTSKRLILSVELSLARKAGPGLSQTRVEVTQAWVCPHGAHRQMDHYRMGQHSSRKETQGFQPTHESPCADQEGLSWFWKAALVFPVLSPSHPSVGPLGFGMVADPNVSQGWAEAGAQPGLPSTLGPFCPLALNLRLDHSQVRVPEAPLNPSLLSALWGTQGLRAAGSLSLKTCQEEESPGRSRRLVWQAEHWGP